MWRLRPETRATRGQPTSYRRISICHFCGGLVQLGAVGGVRKRRHSFHVLETSPGCGEMGRREGGKGICNSIVFAFLFNIVHRECFGKKIHLVCARN